MNLKTKRKPKNKKKQKKITSKAEPKISEESEETTINPTNEMLKLRQRNWEGQNSLGQERKPRSKPTQAKEKKKRQQRIFLLFFFFFFAIWSPCICFYLATFFRSTGQTAMGSCMVRAFAENQFMGRHIKEEKEMGKRRISYSNTKAEMLFIFSLFFLNFSASYFDYAHYICFLLSVLTGMLLYFLDYIKLCYF